MSNSFIRARSPAQKTQRQAQILEAARGVVERLGADAATMSGMAKEAGIAQSAFYRYFKSKEEILAHLLVAEADRMTDSMRVHLPECADFPQVADRFAAICADRPLFCALASDLAPTLEHNIPHDRLVAIKREFARVQGDWVDALTDCTPIQNRDTAATFIRSTYVVLAGLWPVTLERPGIREATKEAGLSGTFGSFRDEYARLLICLARGLESRP